MKRTANNLAHLEPAPNVEGLAEVDAAFPELPADHGALLLLTRSAQASQALASASERLMGMCGRLQANMDDQREAFEDVLLIFAEDGYRPAAQVLRAMRQADKDAASEEAS